MAPAAAAHELVFLGVALAGLLLRASVGLGPYSGYNTPPKFGDFECQRHWMEITYHTPATEWYTNTTDNDLTWWGLDYPPLTAYWSFLFGAIAHYLDPAIVALHASRGLESATVKLFMRSSVLVGDALVFFPSAAFFISRFYGNKAWDQRLLCFALVVLQPGLVLVDHGHFQYNSVSLGLTMLAAAFLVRDNSDGSCVLGAIAFSLALNYKQMSLYYALPFFVYILGAALRRPSWAGCLRRVVLVGLAVIATFAVLWWPWLSLDGVKNILSRVFPVGRGLFEDKVANVWCSIAPIIKLKELYSVPFLTRMCAITTLCAALPKCLYCLANPTPRVFVETLFNTALAFFLFSYHVHEKSALLPGLVASMLALDYPTLSFVFNIYACFGMFPLLKREGLALQYACVMALYAMASRRPVAHELASLPNHQALAKAALAASIAGMLVLHALDAFVVPPKRLPDLWTVAITTYSCAHFCLMFALSALPLSHKVSKEKRN